MGEWGSLSCLRIFWIGKQADQAILKCGFISLTSVMREGKRNEESFDRRRIFTRFTFARGPDIDKE